MEGFKAFEELDDNTTVSSAEDAAKKAARLAEKKAQKEATIAKFADPGFAAVVNTLSESIVVVNTLGHEGVSNIVSGGVKEVTNADGTKEEKRNLIPTPGIVGYKIQNVGDAPINYTTKEYAKTADGVWEGTEVQATLAPGAEAILSKKYMTMLCCIPEISFTLKNGILAQSSKKFKKDNVDAVLESYYFKSTEDGIKVNSDEMKISISEGVTDKEGNVTYIVKPEFCAVFGYLNNEKTKAVKEKAPKAVVTKQTISASFVHDLLTGNVM